MDYPGCVVVVVRNLETCSTSEYAELLKEHNYQVRYVAAGQDPVPVIKQYSPVAVCFQFDYPDQSGLLELRLTKQLLPSVPLLMVTQSHSEQLAVWAFRTHVWDYFVQPVETARFIEVISTLTAIRHGKPAEAARASLDANNAIPPEARLRCTNDNEDRSVMDQVLTYLNANLHKRIVQADVAERFGLSPFQFSRMFKRLCHVTFQTYLLTRRIEEAKRLLANPKVSVTDICFTVGFHDLSYFTRIFQRQVGLPPSRYRTAQAEQAAAAEAAASVEDKHRSVELVSAKS